MKILIAIPVLFLTLSNLNAQQDNCKCCTEQHDDFDFWEGKWEVTNKKGELAGYSTIEKIQDKCVIKENWNSAKGNYSGMSTNFYNSKLEQWEQLWLDNQGGSLHLKGNRTANKMILQTDEVTNKEGKPFVHRITWTKNENGTVRQLWEMITDEKNIQVAFDGLYTKVTAE